MDLPIHGEDMFEVYASVDDYRQAVSEQGYDTILQYDTRSEQKVCALAL